MLVFLSVRKKNKGLLLISVWISACRPSRPWILFPNILDRRFCWHNGLSLSPVCPLFVRWQTKRNGSWIPLDLSQWIHLIKSPLKDFGSGGGKTWECFYHIQAHKSRLFILGLARWPELEASYLEQVATLAASCTFPSHMGIKLKLGKRLIRLFTLGSMSRYNSVQHYPPIADWSPEQSKLNTSWHHPSSLQRRWCSLAQ